MKFITKSIILIIILILFFYLSNIFLKSDVNYIPGYLDMNKDYIEPKIYENFITKDEAEYIIGKSKEKFAPSMIAEKDNNLNENIRKSETAWIEKNDPIAKRIIMRLCNMLDEPFENTEDLQIVRYKDNGYYRQHHDSCCELSKTCIDFNKIGGHRKITMVIYLNDNFENGGTHFPTLGKTYKPPKYSGILFYSLGKDSRKCHPKSLHAGLPITSGEKYIANIWIREYPYYP